MTGRTAPASRWKEQSDRAAQKVRFFVITDFADVIDERVVHQRANDFIEIVLIGPIDFCRDLERDAASYGNFDRAIDPVCTENPIRVYRMIESAKLAR
jgi:hypothetical protein